MANVKSLWNRLFKHSPDKSRKPQIGSAESDEEVYEIEMPDGTKFKIPEMTPSRPHWG